MSKNLSAIQSNINKKLFLPLLNYIIMDSFKNANYLYIFDLSKINHLKVSELYDLLQLVLKFHGPFLTKICVNGILSIDVLRHLLEREKGKLVSLKKVNDKNRSIYVGNYFQALN